jgi:hypothetical protein
LCLQQLLGDIPRDLKRFSYCACQIETFRQLLNMQEQLAFHPNLMLVQLQPAHPIREPGETWHCRPSVSRILPFPHRPEFPAFGYFRAPFPPTGSKDAEGQEHNHDKKTMGSDLMYYIPVMGLVGLVVMIGKAMWVNKQDAGDANMQELAGYIASGASAFLKAEWKVSPAAP